MTKDEAIMNLIQELESVANFMRGMRLDPNVPMHTKDALEVRVGVIDELTESMLEQSYEDAGGKGVDIGQYFPGGMHH